MTGTRKPKSPWNRKHFLLPGRGGCQETLCACFLSLPKKSSKSQEKVWRFNISPQCQMFSSEGRELSEMPSRMNASHPCSSEMPSTVDSTLSPGLGPDTVVDGSCNGCVEGRSDFLNLLRSCPGYSSQTEQGSGAPCQAGAAGCAGRTSLGCHT